MAKLPLEGDMKTKKSIFLLLIIPTLLFSQSEGAFPFSILQQSTMLMGAGQIGAALPMKEASGFYFNPAQLGYFSRENNIAVFAMPEKTKWFPDFFGNTSFNSYGIAAGNNFSKSSELPLSVGVGYIHNKFDYGEYIQYNPTGTYQRYNSYDSFDYFGVGASYDIGIILNAGIAYKHFASSLPYTNETGYTSIKKYGGNAFDFGFMITAPMSKLLFDDVKIILDENSIIKPNFDFTLGYSLTNYGDEVYLVDPAQSDPIARTARLGYTIDLSADLILKQTKITVVDYSFTAEAEDVLINRTNDFDLSYDNIFGKISIGKHLINLNSDQSVVVHKGHILRLFDTMIFTSGRYNGRGFANIKSSGFGLSLEGIFKLLNSASDNNLLRYITKNFNVEFYTSTNFVDSELETDFKSIILYFRGISL